jgi:hypothetical protein
MPTVKQRIMAFLQDHPEGIDDDDLASELNLTRRQQANGRCRELEKEGLVQRRIDHGKIHNFWAGTAITPVLSIAKKPETGIQSFKNWFWEGNVQSKVIVYLSANHYQIRSVADTANHQQGIDIIAEKNGKPLWVSVKGYPRGTERTNATVQAAHWFKEVIFDMIEYRERNREVLLAIALPDYPRYHSLAKKISWFKSVVNFSYYWVKEDGGVTIE